TWLEQRSRPFELQQKWTVAPGRRTLNRSLVQKMLAHIVQRLEMAARLLLYRDRPRSRSGGCIESGITYSRPSLVTWLSGIQYCGTASGISTMETRRPTLCRVLRRRLSSSGSDPRAYRRQMLFSLRTGSFTLILAKY